MCFKYSILVSNVSDDSIFMLRFWIVCADMALLPLLNLMYYEKFLNPRVQ